MKIGKGKQIRLKKIKDEVYEIAYEFQDLLKEIEENSEHEKLKKIKDDIFEIGDKLEELLREIEKNSKEKFQLNI